MKGRAPAQATRGGDLAVVMTCEWCGKEIRLVAGRLGPELADAGAFLAEHRRCLTSSRLPRQRTSA